MKKRIGKEAAFMSAQARIDVVLKKMIDSRVSSCLIHDSDDVVVGIVTERDILRKISLLDVDRKLQRKINTIMHRPIRWVRQEYLFDDIAQLHRQHRLRHFPICRGEPKEVKRADVVGIITVTDLARKFLDEHVASLQSTSAVS